jgi:hypothetical protein
MYICKNYAKYVVLLMDACLLFQVSSRLAFLSDEGRNFFHVWYMLLLK